MRRSLLTLFAALVLGMVAAAPASASEDAQASLTPTTSAGVARPYIIVDLTQGTTTKDSVTLVNKSSAPITFDLYAADAFNDSNGAFVLRSRADPRVDVGAWIQLPLENVTVPPATAVELPFTIAVPANATSGDHAGGIVALARTTGEAPDQAGGATVTIRNGVGARIYGRVAGPTHTGLAVRDLKVDPDGSLQRWAGATSKVTVSYRVENTGNVRLVPNATAELRGPIGLGRVVLERQLGELLPGQSQVVRETVDVRPVGRLTAEVTVTAQDARAHARTTLWLVPWLPVSGALLVPGLAATWLARRRRRASFKLSEATEETHETAESARS